VANVVPSSVASRGTMKCKSFGIRATIYGDFVDDAGNRFYQYDMEQAKAGLKEEGYALSEINKYSLNN
jgi:hypothetical protein